MLAVRVFALRHTREHVPQMELVSRLAPPTSRRFRLRHVPKAVNQAAVGIVREIVNHAAV